MVKMSKYSELFGQCTIDYLNLFELRSEETEKYHNMNQDILVVNCLMHQTGVSPSFQLRFYIFELEADGTPVVKLLEFLILSEQIEEVKITKSNLLEFHLHVIVLTKNFFKFDTNLFLIDIKYDQKGNIFIIDFSAFNGVKLGFD